MEKKINKRTTKDSIEYLELECIVNNRIHDYVSKYHNYPKYIKLPLWIFDCLKQTMCEVDLKIDYKTEEFTFFNLKVCETVSIEKPEEIKEWNNLCNDDLDIFLWHSDCDGKLTPKECKKIYDAMKDLKVEMQGHNYIEMNYYDMHQLWLNMLKHCYKHRVNMYFY